MIATLAPVIAVIAVVLGPASDYQAALTSIEAAIDYGNREPEEAIEPLESALDALAKHPLAMVGDERALELRAMAQLGLARAYLFVGRERDAIATMDTLVLDSQGASPPVDSYGPTISSLYAQRAQTLAEPGFASIEVNCGVPCQVYIQERPVERASGPLLLGDYRVVVIATDDSVAPLRAQVLLAEVGTVERVTYAGLLNSAPDEAGFPVPSTAATVTPIPAKARMAPRWLEISGVAVGVGLLVTGAVLLAFDGKCPGGLHPIADAQQCPRTYNNLASGLAVASVGGAALLGFGVVLAIDESRARHTREQTALLTWTARF